MKLDDLRTSDTAVLKLTHPVTGVPLTQDNGKPVTITLAGQDSERYRAADRKAADRRLSSMSTGRRTAMTAAGIEEDGLARLSAATVEWDGISLEGEVLSASADNARKLYQSLPWVREQAESFIGDRSNYFRTADAA